MSHSTWSKLRSRLSYANVIATIALFLALTGAATAASGSVPFLSVGSPAGGDLTGTYPNPSIADGAITSGKFDSSAVAPDSAKLGGVSASGYVQGSSYHLTVNRPGTSEETNDGLATVEGVEIVGQCDGNNADMRFNFVAPAPDASIPLWLDDNGATSTLTLSPAMGTTNHAAVSHVTAQWVANGHLVTAILTGSADGSTCTYNAQVTDGAF